MEFRSVTHPYRFQTNENLRQGPYTNINCEKENWDNLMAWQKYGFIFGWMTNTRHRGCPDELVISHLSLSLSFSVSLFLCMNFRMKPRIWLSLGVNRSRPRITLVTTVIFHEFYFIIFISIIILNYVIVVISLNFLYLIRNSKFIVWKMENNAKSFIVELAPFYVQSVWRV